MPNFNRVILMGHLTREPQLRYTPNNTAVCQVGLAVNHRWKDANGEQKEEVTFVDCDAWGRTAEAINQYLRKGQPIFIEGRLKLDQWQDKDGSNRSKLKVVIESFQFLTSKSDSQQATQQAPRQPAALPARQEGPRSSPPPEATNPAPAPAHDALEEEHIPF